MDIMMSQKEAKRAQIMELLTAGVVTKRKPVKGWRQRKLSYTVMTKAQRQAAQADSKTVNARVDEALAKSSRTSNKGHKPAPNHPWRKYPDGKPATRGCNVTP